MSGRYPYLETFPISYGTLPFGFFKIGMEILNQFSCKMILKHSPYTVLDARGEMVNLTQQSHRVLTGNHTISTLSSEQGSFEAVKTQG